MSAVSDPERAPVAVNQPWRVVHLATSQTGGAGVAARRLHDALRKQGMQSDFLSALGSNDEEARLHLLPRETPSLRQRVMARLGQPWTSRERWDRTTRSLRCTDVFTSPIEGRGDLAQHNLVKSAQLVHLHWVSGLLPWSTFFQMIDVPLVWTLHDMNPFLGIFHYETDRQRGSDEGRRFDSMMMLDKKWILSAIRRLVVVTPSRWLGAVSQASDVMSHLQHVVIPYGLDTSTFKPLDQRFARQVLGLPEESRLLMLVAESLDDPRKGFDLASAAVSDPKSLPGWQILAVGKGRGPVTSRIVHRLGSITDERLMALAYSAADLTLVSSREDNFPNVVLESLCCGTPVVGTPAGGIPEAVLMPRDGVIAESLTAEALAIALRTANSIAFDRRAIASGAAARFAESVTAAAYTELYHNLLTESAV